MLSSASHNASKPTIIASLPKQMEGPPRLVSSFHEQRQGAKEWSASVLPSVTNTQHQEKIPSPLPHFGAPRPRSPPVSLLTSPSPPSHPPPIAAYKSQIQISHTPPPSCIASQPDHLLLIRATCDLSQVFLVLLRPCFRFSFLHWCKVYFVFFSDYMYLCLRVVSGRSGLSIPSLPCADPGGSSVSCCSSFADNAGIDR